MKRSLILFLLAAGLCGCSKNFWPAHIAMFKAEHAVSKAYALKLKKVPHEQRVPYYREACRRFAEARRYNPDIFTLSRIRDATDSCWRAEEKTLEEDFLGFEEDYARRHPVEYEYGDTDAGLGEY